MDTRYRNYIEEVDLQRYWLVLKRRWLPATAMFVTCVSAAALAALLESNSYEATGQLLFQVDRSPSLTGIGGEISELETTGLKDPLFNQAELAQTSPVLQEVIDTLDLKNSEGEPLSPALLQEGLSILPQPGTDILEITYTSPDPQKAATVVNQLMDAYVARNIALNRAEATAARKFIEEQIPQAKATLDEAAEKLRQFYLQHQIINVEVQSTALFDTLTRIDTQINDVQFQLADVTSRVNEIQQILGLSIDQAQSLEALSASTAVQGALVELEEVQTSLAAQRSLYTENHPSVIYLQNQEVSLRNLLQERVETVLAQEPGLNASNNMNPRTLQMSGLDNGLTAELVNAEVNRMSLISQLASLVAKHKEYLGTSTALPTLELQQRELQQKLAIAAQNYETLVERYQESRLAENQVLASVEIVEPAEVPLQPAPNRSRKLIAAGIVVGIFLGVTLAFCLDLIDKSIKTVKDAEALLGYTLLGLIPRYGTPVDNTTQTWAANAAGNYSPRIITNKQVEPMAAAAYQMLQANLKFITTDHRLRTFTIASSVAQEGKSEVCANLAATIAQTGKQVLIIDADMRSPSQHHLWNVINQVGLSHVLVGEGELSMAQQQITENLTLITAGVTPPNPLALVDSERMQQLVKSLLNQYDYIIIDTPPLAGAADAVFVGKATDGILFVLRPRWVNSHHAVSAKYLLERAGARVLGLVANGIDLRHEHEDYVVQLKTSAYAYNQKTSPSPKMMTVP